MGKKWSSVFQFSGKAFLCNHFTVLLVIFNVLWMSCNEIYCIIWHFLLQKLYKEAYEQSKGTSMNYCDTPKFQIDTVLKNFSDVCIWFMLRCSVLTLLITFVYQLVIIFQVKYKDAYQKNILGHYLGSFEDPHQIHCMKVEAMKSDVSVAIILFSPSYFHFRESSIMVSYWMLILFLEKLQSRLWGGKDKMLLPSDHNSRVWSY